MNNIALLPLDINIIIIISRLTLTEKTRPRLVVKLSMKSSSNCGKVKHAIANLFNSNGKTSSHLATSQTPLSLFSLVHSVTSGYSEMSVSHQLAVIRQNSDEQQQQDNNLTSDFESSDSIEAVFSLGLSNLRFGSASEARFRIEPGSFYDCVIPENIKSLWGPIPLQSLPPGVENKCRAVAHG